MWWWLLLACVRPPTSPAGGAVPDACLPVASRVDPERVGADIAALAASPRRSDARRAETRAALRVALEAAGFTVTERPFTIAGVSGTNVVATGRADGAVLVGAHYDSVETTPGADDNASGVAVALEVARALGPDAPVTYVFFDAEEPFGPPVGADGRNYAYGSQAFVDAGTGARLVFVVESVGYACDACQRVPAPLPRALVDADGRAVYLVGNDAAAAPLADAAAAFAAASPGFRAIPYVIAGDGRDLPASRFSDHAPFWDAGVPAVMITDTALLRNPHYHEPSDTPATLDRAFLAAVTRGTAVAVAAAAGVCR